MPAVLKRLLLILLIFSPAIFTANLVREKAVDVGCWDMWENAPLLQKWHDFRAGKMSWSEMGHHLYSAQIQHRIVVPRLLVIGLTNLSGGDFRWEQYFTFLILFLDSLLLWLLVKRTLGDSGWRWPLMFAINLLIFSPIHYQILFWGSSMWGTIPIACLLGVLLLLGAPRDKGFWWRVALSVLLAEIATHSFAHGLAIWPVLFVLVLLFESASFLKRATAAGGILVIAGVTITCYFQDFINVAHHAYDLKPGDPAMKGASNLFEGDHLMQALRFFFAFIGTWFARTPFVMNPLETAKFFGITTLAIFVITALVFIIRKRSRSQWRAAIPWLALAAYILIVGLMIIKRGADIGEHRAVTPSYLAIRQYLLISMLALPFVLVRRRTDHLDHNESSYTNAIASVLLAAFIVAQIPVWQYGLHLTNVWHHARRQAQALVLFLPHIKPESMKVLDKESKNWHCINAINTLNSLNLLKFKPLKSPDLKWFNRDVVPLGTEKASIDKAEFREDGALELSGNARFSVTEPADAVLITQGDKVIALGQPAPRNALRIYGLDYEFSNVDDMSAAAIFPWKAIIPAAALENSSSSFEVWALNVAGMRIAKIAKFTTSFKVDLSSKTIEIEKSK
ncbi:MAG: hypothetical protein K8R87_01815 [Verrucomicrobia bacterium]|nr:hypothetical protein [Verrucomicrobiota bacterium]